MRPGVLRLVWIIPLNFRDLNFIYFTIMLLIVDNRFIPNVANKNVRSDANCFLFFFFDDTTASLECPRKVGADRRRTVTLTPPHQKPFPFPLH
jgi:hypothetical protein